MTNSAPGESKPLAPQAKVKKKGSKGWLLIALLLLLGGGLWAAYGPGAASRQKAGGHGGGPGAGMGPGGGMSGPVAVTVAATEKGDMPIILMALGTVTPDASVTVRTQINGQLTEVGFQEGQIVQKGDFLAQIDPRPYENTLHQAQGQLAKDQALLKDAELNLERYTKLAAQDSISKQQRDTQDSLVQQYRGAVQTDQAQIDEANLDLTYCHIVSPVTGRVGLRQVDPGNYVQTSDTSGIVTVAQIQPISVLFTIPEDKVPALMKRVKEDAALQAEALDRTQSRHLATGKLVAVDNKIDTSTGTVKLRAAFDNEDGALFPNQFVNIRLLLDTLKDQILLPSQAVQRGSQGLFVYLVAPGGEKVSVRSVTLGPTDGERTVIEKGVSVGDRVVTEGADKLSEGSSITIAGTAAAKTPAAAQAAGQTALKAAP